MGHNWKAAHAVSFNLSCSCGRSVSVSAGQAGTTVACECGQTIAVPSLGTLRELSGRERYEAGTIDTIHAMRQKGLLPAGERCAVSGELTQDFVVLWVEAEKPYVRKESLFSSFVAALIAPIFILAVARARPRFPDLGRQTIVPAPLRVATAHRHRLETASQRKLKRWLCTVPIYADLLREYPLAIVAVRRPERAD
jgi:hypothetical protein